MDKQELLQLLQKGKAANTLTLTPSDLESADQFALLQIVGENDPIRLKKAVIDQTTGDDRLVVSGQTKVLNANMTLKAVFTFLADDLQRYYLLLIPGADWTLATSFSDFPAFNQNDQDLSPLPVGATFTNPVFIISMNCKTISDPDYELKRVAVQDGINFYAAGMTSPLNASIFPEDFRTTFREDIARIPDSIGGVIVPSGIQPYAALPLAGHGR